MNLNLSRLRKPLIVGTLTGNAPLSAQLTQAKKGPIDLLEVRLDTFKISGLPTLLSDLRKKIRAPFLLTDRCWTELGRSVPVKERRENEDRQARLLSVLPYADAIDVEIQQTQFAREMTSIAHRKRKVVVHSLHDFKSKGSRKQIEEWAKRSSQMGGDIFKVAVMPKTDQDLQEFFSWGQKLAGKNHVLIGMGKVGLISRYIAFTFGSVFTYGHLGCSAAPGQPSVVELRKGINDIYGH